MAWRRSWMVRTTLARNSHTTNAAHQAHNPSAPVAGFKIPLTQNGLTNASTANTAATSASHPSQRPVTPVCRITLPTAKKNSDSTPPPSANSTAEAAKNAGTVSACAGLVLSPIAKVSDRPTSISAEPAAAPTSTTAEPRPGSPSALLRTLHSDPTNHKNSAIPKVLNNACSLIGFRFWEKKSFAVCAFSSDGYGVAPVGLVLRNTMNAATNNAAASSPLAAPICSQLRSFFIWTSPGWRRLSAPLAPGNRAGTGTGIAQMTLKPKFRAFF